MNGNIARTLVAETKDFAKTEAELLKTTIDWLRIDGMYGAMVVDRKMLGLVLSLGSNKQ